mgnify:FL=1
MRSARWRNPDRYQQKLAEDQRSVERKEPRGQELVFEFMLNALRLRAGFTLELYSRRTGLDPQTILPRLQRAKQGGLMETWGSDGWRPTDLGFRFLNDLQLLFLDDAAQG